MVLTNQDFLTSLKWINGCLFETISIFFLKECSIISSNFFFSKNKNKQEVLEKCLHQTLENWNVALFQAVGCSNTTLKNMDKSFFLLPTVEKLRKAWLGSISGKDKRPNK